MSKNVYILDVIEHNLFTVSRDRRYWTKMNNGKKTLKENSPGLRFLKKLFDSREVDETEQPKDVRDRYPALQDYDSKSFGDKYRKYKPKSQGKYSFINFLSPLLTKLILCLNTKGSPSTLRARNTEGADLPTEPGSSTSELLMDQNEFHPNYYIADCMDPDNGMAERLTVVLSLSCGSAGQDVKYICYCIKTKVFST